MDDKICEHLGAGRSLDDLGLSSIEGRVDLRGLRAPSAPPTLQISTPAAHVWVAATTQLKSVTWRKLDFSNAKLNSLRLFDATLEDCRFEKTDCRDLRMWGTRVVDCSFRGADLRTAALGGTQEGKRNEFLRVDFSKADLRETAYDSAVFRECNFAHAKLRKVEFNGSVFVNCKFEGVLDQTALHKYGFSSGNKLLPNEMKGVDFSKAKLRSVGLRGMNLEDVKWPADDEHIVIHDYVATLDRVLATLRARTDMPSRQLAAYLGVTRHGAGPQQHTGVLYRKDLVDIVGRPPVDELERMLNEK